MAEYFAFLLRGLGSGGVYAALAMALVVTYRSSGVVNFATGAIGLYVAETYAYLRNGELFIPFPGFPSTVSLGTDELSFAVASVIALVIAALLGMMLHFLVFRPLRAAPAVAKAVASIGVMIVLQAVIGIRLGTNPITTSSIMPDDTVTIFGEAIRSDRLWFAAAIVGVALLLGVLFKYTSFGLATRAAAETEKGAYVTGLSPQRIALANWSLSAVVAGIAGILISPIVPIIPVSYTLFIVPALAAALVGGFTNLAPAVAAGLLIGMLQSELVFLQLKFDWLPAAGLPEMIPLVLILAVLVIRGKPLPDRGAVVTQTLGRAPRPQHLVSATLIPVAIALLAVLVTSGGYRAAIILTFIYGIIGLSWVVITGYAGQVSLAQLSLAGVGAFALFRFAENWSVPFPIAPLLSAAVATVIGVVIGLPALRIRGLPVAVVTLAFAVAVEGFWFLNSDYNGGLGGAPIEAPSIFGYELRVDGLSSRIPFAVMCLTVLTLVGLGVALLRRSSLGASMLAVKANERSAAAAGIDVARTKVVAFAIGSYIAGIGGCLLAYMQGAAIPQTFNAVLGIGIFATVYLSGITTISGGINAGVIAAGGIVFVVLDRNVDLGQWYPVISGVLLILTIIKNPEGIMGGLQEQIRERRDSKRSREPALPAFDRSEAGADVPPPVPGPPILTVDSISVTFGGVRAVDRVSFDVPRGLIVGLIGPNGAGKTTLIDAISGFADSTGHTEFDGLDVTELAPHRRARLGLGRTFQSVELYEDLTVEENIGVGQRAARPTDDGVDDAAALDELCALLRLDGVRHRPVAELSAGYRQLVSIARTLAGRPKVLLLDEPAGGLDSDESQWLGDRLRDIRRAGTTVLMIDHDMNLVLGVCDHIHVLDLGVLIASGTPAEIQGNERVSAAYLGSSEDALVGEST